MYEFESRVRYSEAMHNGRMNPVSISNYFQDCAIFHSASLGKDMNYYKQLGRGWFLNSWQIDIRRYPECGEKIFVATWSYGFRGIYGYRNFILRDKNLEACACANSVWFFTDIVTGQPVRVPEEEGRSYGQEEKFSMEYCPRKIRLPDNFSPRSPHIVANADIDTNGHVNNARYIKMAWGCLPETLIPSEQIWRIRAEYKKAAQPGDTIYPQTACSPVTFTKDASLEGFSGRCFDPSRETNRRYFINLAAENSSRKTAASFSSITFDAKETAQEPLNIFYRNEDKLC